MEKFVNLTRHLHLLLCLLTLTCQSSAQQQQDNGNSTNNLPICIVGGGISGLGVANMLKEKGYEKILVFEKEGRVGGKMRTFREKNANHPDDEIMVEMGPLFFITFEDILGDYLQKFNLTPVPYDYSAKDRWLIDTLTGKTFAPPPIPPAAQKILQHAIESFVAETGIYDTDFDFGYTSASPSLFYPIGEWLAQRNLTILAPIFKFYMTAQGYGALQDVPALYALKLVGKTLVSFSRTERRLLRRLRRLKGKNSFGKNLLKSSQHSVVTLKEGLDVFANKLAQQVDVYRGHEVLQILREKDHQILTILNGGGKGGKKLEIQCRNVVLAFPPLLPALKKMIRGFTTTENKVMGQVKVHRYMSAAHVVPEGLQHAIYYDENVKGGGEVVGFVKQSSRKLKNVYSSYSWIRGDFDVPAKTTELTKMEEKRRKLLGKIDQNSTTLSRMSVDYFPHVSSKGLRQGFYSKFQTLQGFKGLYYATTLNSFETMNEALNAAHGLVTKYF